jgi:hypothetical protein
MPEDADVTHAPDRGLPAVDTSRKEFLWIQAFPGFEAPSTGPTPDDSSIYTAPGGTKAKSRAVKKKKAKDAKQLKEAKERSKKKKPPISDFPENVGKVLGETKRLYCALLLLFNPLPNEAEKKDITKHSFKCITKGVPVDGTSSYLAIDFCDI